MAKKIPQINASSMADISFLLLIFFLVTTSMDVNKGLSRRLPPYVDEQNAQKKDQNINKRNLMVVKINSNNQLMVNGEKMMTYDRKLGKEVIDLKNLRSEVRKFLVNERNDDHLPKLIEEEFDFGSPVGKKMVKYTKDHIISVQNDVDTKYQAYLDVQNELVAAYNEVRDNCARRYYGKAYVELEEAQQKVIQKIYPQKISEAEPKNYNN